MAAPRKKLHDKPTNLTLNPAIKAAAQALAGKDGKSLSQLVEELLVQEIKNHEEPSSAAAEIQKARRPRSRG